MEILEFKNVNDLNDYLDNDKGVWKYEIIPIPRMFEHPNSKLIVSCISYVLIKRGV